MKYIQFVFAFLILSSCKSQEPNTLVPNLEDTNFQYDSVFLIRPGYGHFATNAVVVDDGYIITGQNITDTGTIVHRSSLLKLSFDGDLLIQKNYGNNTGFEYARNETLFKIDGSRIIQVGEKKEQLWVREIDNNLNVLRDTVFPADIRVLYDPQLGQVNDKLVIVSDKGYSSNNLFNIYFISKNLDDLEFHPITGTDLNYLSYTMHDAEFSRDGEIYVLGEGCLEEDSEGICQKTEWSVIIFDANNKSIVKKNIIEKGGWFNAIKVYKNKIYVGGSFATKLETPVKYGRFKNYSTSKNIDSYVAIYNRNGNLLSEFTHDENLSDFLSDIIVYDNNIQLVGWTNDMNKSRSLSTYFSFGLDGKLLERRIFGDGTYDDNQMNRIVRTPDNKVLLLGQGRAWRIIIK